MPRNSSGTHTLPTGQPVISGTVISATTHNALAGDISAELTDSLSRSGKGAMTAPLRTPDGTKTAPAHAFSNETGSGVYRAGAGDVRHAVLGVDALKLSNTGAAVPGTLDVTGAATFAVAPVLNSGAFVAAGGVTFNASADQTIAKTGGNLNVNVPTGQVFAIQLNGVTKWQMDGTGKFGGDGTNVLTGVASPSAASDAATKGYVDAGPAPATYATSAAITPGASWNQANASWARKSGRVVQIGLLLTSSGAVTGGSISTFGTLPADLRPAVDMEAIFHVAGYGAVTLYAGRIVASTGVVEMTFAPAVPGSGTQYLCYATYLTA